MVNPRGDVVGGGHPNEKGGNLAGIEALLSAASRDARLDFRIYASSNLQLGRGPWPGQPPTASPAAAHKRGCVSPSPRGGRPVGSDQRPVGRSALFDAEAARPVPPPPGAAR